MKRSTIFSIIIGSAFILVFAATFIFDGKQKDLQIAKATIQDIEFNIVSKGEIKAIESIPIFPPELFYDNEVRIHELKISKMIPEGTFVKKGDFVATLEGNEVDRFIKDLRQEITEHRNTLALAKIDSSVRLSQERDKIEQTKMNLEEQDLKLEQSKYESKSIQRQAKLVYERTNRNLQNKIRNYTRRIVMEESKIENIEIRMKESKSKLQKYESLKRNLKVLSPAEGLLLYGRKYGRKMKAGSSIHRWGSNTIIAEIPNLNDLVSVTYINEIDITKIAVGQTVSITVDAFPEELYEGQIISIANMGQKTNGSDLKSFKVEVKVTSESKKLKPAMTTNNKVTLKTFNDVLTVPLNSVYSDGMHHYVYLKNNFKTVKKQVITGVQDDKNIIIKDGISPNDNVLIREPENKDELQMVKI